MNVLLLGGTSEASQLARMLADDGRFRATLSLAGRTASPAPQPLPTRSGGFGGAQGLASFLHAHRIGALIDATHPFATQIHRNAAEASRMTDLKLLAIVRPAWTPGPADAWRPVATMQEAVAALGSFPRRVFLTIGQKDLTPFAAAPWHDYLVRSVDPPPVAVLPPKATVITARGPFGEADEKRLLTEWRTDVLVTKNSGGTATRAKLAAARLLGLPVVMVMRPPQPEDVERVETAEEAMAWLHRTLRGA